MIEGIVTTWFVFTALSLAFVAIDIRATPESVVLKWAFVILTAFTGPFGAFFYVLGCREPLKGTHELYVSSTWRQVLGSTMHCAAGDGVGIIAGAAIAILLHLSPWSDFLLEYALGFGFGWAFFQAFAMRDMYGGSYSLSLKATFIPELVSMNLLMSGMLPTMKLLSPLIENAEDPFRLPFWFVVSMALIVGFLFAYPVNWWLVVNNMKHGMLTVRPTAAAGASGGVQPAHAGHAGSTDEDAASHGEHSGGKQPGAGTILILTLATFAFLTAALWVTGGFFD